MTTALDEMVNNYYMAHQLLSAGEINQIKRLCAKVVEEETGLTRDDAIHASYGQCGEIEMELLSYADLLREEE